MYADPLPANAELFTRQAKGLFIFAPVNSRSSIREIGKFVEEHGLLCTWNSRIEIVFP